MTSPLPPSLGEILAYARAGAAEQAWRMFRAAGLEGVRDDPAVLAAHGRLLKARAVAAPPGSAQRTLYAEAAQAYAAAGVAGGETYLLINAATLALLGGDGAAARAGAERVLAALAANPQEPETPYWLAATRAEALLVLGRSDEARAALAEAVAVAPRAWEDHAPTLRQFALILAAQGADAGWLDALRPPRTLHFAGPMALGGQAGAVAERAAVLIQEERIGFGYGALAAGADIVIAEQLVARGGELNVVLPTDPQTFRATSVEPAGGDWTARFDALLGAAESVRAVSSAAPASHPLAIQLAAEVAMGRALLRAGQLATGAVQIVVVDRQRGRGRASDWSRARWGGLGRRQHAIAVTPDAPRAAAAEAAGSARLAAILAIEIASGPAEQLADDVLPRMRAALAGAPSPVVPVAWQARTAQLAFADPAQAAAAALRLRASGVRLRIGGAYGLALEAKDPFGPGAVLMGAAVELPAQVLASTPEGAIHLSDDFAAALQAAAPDLRLEPVGALPADEPGEETGLYALVG